MGGEGGSVVFLASAVSEPYVKRTQFSSHHSERASFLGNSNAIASWGGYCFLGRYFSPGEMTRAWPHQDSVIVEAFYCERFAQFARPGPGKA